MGFVDLRPVTDGSEISETYLVPPDSLVQKNIYFKCLRPCDQYGEQVTCTPYIMPESIFGVCIHASMWICLKILEGMIEKPLSIPEIQKTAYGSPYTDKQGLPFVQTARILRMSRAYSFYINNSEALLDDDRMLMELYAYVESGLPVIVGVDTRDLAWWNGAREHGYHSIVAIGHSMKDNMTDGFIFHDESALPYQMLNSSDVLKAWHIPRLLEFSDTTVRELLVAVPPEVSLPFHRVFQQFQAWLLTLIVKGIVNLRDFSNLEFRPILIPSFFLFVTPKEIMFSALRDLETMPKYLWCIYLFDRGAEKNDLEHAKGFFIRDATRQTQFRALYLRNQKSLIYQTSRNKIFQRWEGRLCR